MSAAWADCSAPSTPVSKAIDACKKNLAANNGKDFPTEAALAGGQPDYCQIGSDSGINPDQRLNDKLCNDPNGFVCAMSKTGRVLDSQCHLALSDKKENARTEDYAKTKCAVDEIYQKYSGECLNPASPKCREIVLTNHRKEIVAAEHAAIYGAADKNGKTKKDRLLDFFGRVRDKFLYMIQNSKRIDPAARDKLLKKISSIELAVNEKELNQDPACHLFSPTGASTTVQYVSNVKDADGHTFVHVCAGVVANLDNFNPYALMALIGHEIAHGIDPCTLEIDALQDGNPAPNIGKSIYWGKGGGKPGDETLIDCLRGTAPGPNTCLGAKLACNSPTGIQNKCNSDYPTGPKSTVDSCISIANNQMPNCPWSEEPKLGDDDAAAYKSTGEPRDQLQEGFADFMSADVMGWMMEEDNLSGKLDARGRRNALVSIASLHAGVHGPCMNSASAATKDEHPFGDIRTNWLTMGSFHFKYGVGCVDTTAHGGKSCRGF